MDWFEQLTGFAERDGVRAHLTVDGADLVSALDGRRLRAGHFSMPCLAELRAEIRTALGAERGHRATVTTVVGDVGALHADPDNAGATFQAASQFNALEMPSPGVLPEAGITGYAHDRTQGPACAIACGAGTIYRNWFVSVGDDGGVDPAAPPGQTATRQLNGLAAISRTLGIDDGMTNGYALPTGAALRHAADAIGAMTEPERDHLRGLLRVAVHADAEVTIARRGDRPGHRVTQVYASAVPVAYSDHDADLWEPLARIVLDAAYEATLAVAVRHGSGRVFLTLLGGGVFGNPKGWITAAIDRATSLRWPIPLDVAIVTRC